jgi:hypothetical protein
MDQSPRGCIGSRDFLAQHEHLASAGHAGKTRDEPGSATIGRECKRREGGPEPGIVGHDGEVRGQKNVETQTNDPAPRGTDNRGLTSQHRRDEAIDVTVHATVYRAHARAYRAGCSLAQVEAGAKVIALALQMNDPDGLVTGGGVHCVGQRVHDGVSEAVSASRAIEAQLEDFSVMGEGQPRRHLGIWLHCCSSAAKR